jgi:hypothetical protein
VSRELEGLRAGYDALWRHRDVVTRGRGQASGVEAEMKFTQVWRFEDGVARGVVWYESREQALVDLRAQ